MKRFHRQVHALSAFAVALCGVATLSVWPDLKKDVVTAFGTVSGFVTFYGVVFTIIEVMYTKGAAQQAATEARNAANKASAMFELSNVSECIACIETVLGQIHNQQTAESALLSRIVKMYSAQFATEIDDAASPSRRNLDAVDAYMLSLRHRRNATENAHLRHALFRMTSQLSAESTKIKGKVV